MPGDVLTYKVLDNSYRKETMLLSFKILHNYPANYIYHKGDYQYTHKS